MSRFMALGVALFALLAFSATAQAQYPEPENNVTPQGPTSCAVGCTVQVTCTVRDATGKVLGNELVYFEIVSAPSGAQLQQTSGVSNAAGQVTVPLYVGTQAGTIRVICGNGDVTATYVTQVLGAQITPPTTGDAGLLGDSKGYAAPMAGMLALSLVAMVAARRFATSR